MLASKRTSLCSNVAKQWKQKKNQLFLPCFHEMIYARHSYELISTMLFHPLFHSRLLL